MAAKKLFTTVDAKNTGMIQFHSISANNLPNRDLVMDSDPYVVFSNKKNGQSVQTKMVKNCADPIWNEHLMLSVNENEQIDITIYDQDTVTVDDFLCSMTLDIRSKCKDGKEVNLKDLPMNVEKKFEKRHEKPTISFSALYQSFSSLKKGSL